MNNDNVLIRHNYIAIPAATVSSGNNQDAIATVMMNLSHYGFALNVDAYRSLSKLEGTELVNWWQSMEKELKSITGADRKIADFVVYKNFPAEVLNKSEAQYWFAQILMYWGLSNELFTETVQPRPKMSEQPRCTVLRNAKKDTLGEIFNSYLASPARWKDEELNDVLFLSEQLPVNIAKLAFKENLVRLASFMMANGKAINISTATDVLRLAAGLSDGDVSLREKTKFKSFKKSVRRFVLSTLESCKNLSEDVARRPEMWKRLFHQLHPGDYKKRFPRTVQVADDLYNDRLVTYNSKVEQLLSNNSSKVLKVLSERPGEFRRRLVHTVDLFGNNAVKAFMSDEVLDKLTTYQLVSLRSHLETLNGRQHRTFPPKGNWGKMQIGEPRPIDQKYVKAISTAIGKKLSERVPKVKTLDDAATLIKLPNNGEVGYARGTAFCIPEDVKFIRTASYWKARGNGYGNIWFDNSWNFFDEFWQNLGACCWTQVKYGKGAVFSGDPTNSKEMQGRAAQLIDLYPDELVKNGVRYAVWNILCFSRISFSDAEDVFAALQLGADANTGKLFEPSRCQLSFPLAGKSMTKYICLIDLKARELVYLDANLHGNTRSAASNGLTMQKNMPAFMEYIRSLPSVHDLFCESVDAKNGSLHVLYSDRDVELNGESAYVFRQENKVNTFKPVDLNNLLT